MDVADKPVRGLARFTARLQRGLSLASRGNPAVALDAVTHTVDRAAREGAGRLFARQTRRAVARPPRDAVCPLPAEQCWPP